MVIWPEPMLAPPAAERRPNPLWLFAGAAVVVLILVAGVLIGGLFGEFTSQITRVVLFVPLAVLAYYGLYYGWAKVLTVLWMLLTLGLVAMAVTGSSALGDVPLDDITAGNFVLDEGTIATVGRVALGITASTVIGFLGFLRPVRRVVNRCLPLDPDNFVHTIALVFTVALGLMCLVPLAVTGAPPIIEAVSSIMENMSQLLTEEAMAAGLRGELFGLVWVVVGSFFAVGWLVRRDFRQTLVRLGLVRPTARQVAFAIVAALALVATVIALQLAIAWVWERMGWPQSAGTEFEEAFGLIMSPFMTPLGAVIIGLTAGLGEEVAVRGVLQPRLGILISNVLFTALHAFQYYWDAMLVVFLIGIVLGLIRRRTNTTTSAIVHGVYDFALIMASTLLAPMSGQ